MTTIAIIGATGMLGQPVTDALLQAGFSVRIIARNVVKARARFPTANVVAGDLRDPVGLTAALAGCDALYLNLSIRQTEKPGAFHTETDGLRNLLPAARGRYTARGLSVEPGDALPGHAWLRLVGVPRQARGRGPD